MKDINKNDRKIKMGVFVEKVECNTEAGCDISVVIPVYNVADHLETCVRSVVHQSKRNIEIICVDDGSTDQSLQILKRAALEDDRICIIQNGRNRGSLYTRKRGVMTAVGKYIMFLDGDDYFADDACEVAYLETVRSNTDILQFGTDVINAGNAPGFEVEFFERYSAPCESRIYGAQILKACFEEEKYNHNLFNKIYRAELCKKAFSQLDNNHYCMAEDMLAYFVLSYYAESYVGIPDKLYHYNFAIGISRPGKLDIKGVDGRCCGAESIFAIRRFLEAQGMFGKYESVYRRIERRMLVDNFDAWYYKLPYEERDEGYAVFEKHWGKDKVILGLLYDIENKDHEIRKCKHELESISYRLGRFMTWIPRKIMRYIRNHLRRNGD